MEAIQAPEPEGSFNAWLAQAEAWLRAHWAVVLAVTLAYLWGTYGSQLLLPYRSNNPDEVSYLLQAQLMQTGRLRLAFPSELHPFFNTFQVANIGDTLVPKYGPGTAAVMAAGGLLFGSMYPVLGILAGAAVALSYALSRELGLSQRASTFASLTVCFSALFLLLNIIFLSYMPALLLHLTCVLLLLRGMRTHSWSLMCGAGTALGTVTLFRPYDVLLMGVALSPLFVDVLFKRHFALLAAFAAGGLLPVSLTLLYNWGMTGSPVVFPFQLWDAYDKLGFGQRRFYPGDPIFYFGPQQAWRDTSRQIISFATWIFAGPFLLVLAALNLLTGEPVTRARLTLLLWAVIFPVGYFVYFGNVYNPHYYFPALVPLAILASEEIDRLGQPHRHKASILFGCLMIVNLFFVQQRLQIKNGVLVDQAKLASTHQYVASVPGLDNGIVFLHRMAGDHLGEPFHYLINGPDLQDTATLYALNWGSENFRLLDAYPDRTSYRLDYFGSFNDPPVQPAPAQLVPLERYAGRGLQLQMRVTNPTDLPYVRAYVWNGDETRDCTLDDTSSQGDTHLVAWQVSPEGVEANHPCLEEAGDLAALTDETYLTLAVAFMGGRAASTAEVFELRFPLRLGREGSLEVIAPGEPWFNLNFPDAEGWRLQPVERVLEVSIVAEEEAQP